VLPGNGCARDSPRPRKGGKGRFLRGVAACLAVAGPQEPALLAAAIGRGEASSAASVIERRTEIGLNESAGCRLRDRGIPALPAEQTFARLRWAGAPVTRWELFLARLVGEKIFGAAPKPSVIVFFLWSSHFAYPALRFLGSAPFRSAARHASSRPPYLARRMMADPSRSQFGPCFWRIIRRLFGAKPPGRLFVMCCIALGAGAAVNRGSP